MPSSPSASPYERILSAALRLLDEGGIEAVSTRAVASDAGVQAPAIYRLFGDKQGLLEAAAERGYADWVAGKGARARPDDPVDALRAGWDEAIEFGLAHPAMYHVAAARATRSPAFAAGSQLLEEKIRRVAAAGRLRTTPEQAVALMQATGRGVTLALLEPGAVPPDPALGTIAREAVIAAITTDVRPEHDDSLRSTAVALQAHLPRTRALRPAERALLHDWLDRIASGPEAEADEPEV